MAPEFTYCHNVTLDDLAAMRRFIEHATEQLGASDHVVTELVLAVNEAVTNIILHGYRGTAGLVEIEVQRQEERLIICIRDQAPLFDPTTNPTPDINAPIENRGCGGMGIHLMRHFTHSMVYQVTSDGRNELTLIKLEEKNGNHP